MPYKDIWRIGGGVYQNQAINAIKILCLNQSA